MGTVSRRTILRGAAFAAGQMPFSSLLSAAARAATRTRCDVAAPEGEAMLKIYARGVEKMMAMPERDPRGWLFQWYIHAVRGDRNKAGEISRIYGEEPTPERALAQATWNTCEAHSNPARENFFLPWHRMFLHCFEQIVRHVTGEDGFALPYWNYTAPNQRALPAEFRRPNDPAWRSLHRIDRHREVNEGAPIDQVEGAAILDLAAMHSSVYADNGADAGFCANIDNAPHCAVHENIGTGKGMGSVPWAANDPIFWLHHSNIDRIWASWNKAGGVNASLSEVFTFAGGEGQKVALDAADFIAADTRSLGYVYDSYLPRPPDGPPFPKPGAAVAFTLHAVGRRPFGPIRLGASPAHVRLAPPANLKSSPSVSSQALLEALKTLPAERHVVLRIEYVRTNAAPGTAYDVYFGLADGARPTRASPSFVGSIALFGAAPHGEHAIPNLKGRSFSFVVTQQVRMFLRDRGAAAAPAVTFVAVGSPQKDAVPTVGRVALVSF
jgi:hypothetical protein